jgi:4-amino-4-deoxy-L-arabinose transferase-like glycosyltransferase
MVEQERNVKLGRFFWMAVIVWCVSMALYLYNIDGWLATDDEGTDLYEIWRIGEGDVPGVDVFTEQPPVFLLGGVGLGLLTDFNVAVLRGTSALLVLGSSWALFLLGREMWGARVGFLAMVFYLLNHMVYEQGRLYRPDPWMLAFSVLGLYFFVLAQTRGRRLYILISGAVYGVATLCKLFGVMPVGGCLLFLVYQVLTRRASVRRTFGDMILFLLPIAVIVAGGLLAFYPPGTAYYGGIDQHLRVGYEEGLSHRLLKVLIVLAFFLAHNAAFLFALPTFRWLTAHRVPGPGVLAWQMVSGLAYFVLSRPVYERYWLYLVPVFALILGFLVDRVLGWLRKWKSWGRRLCVPLGVVLAALVIVQSIPSVLENVSRREEGTLALAGYIAARTAPGDVVLCDYAGLNFYARRPSVYQASIIAWDRVAWGFITGDVLIDEIERKDVKMVLLHVRGGEGDLAPAHLVYLRDYEAFYDYLNRRFCLVDTCDRVGQIFEVYQTCSNRE